MTDIEDLIIRNNGDVKDFLHHIDQDLLLQSMLAYKLKEGIAKDFTHERMLQLQALKSEIQLGLTLYNNNLKEEKAI